MIPERIAKEIEEMCSRISEQHREGCKGALEQSWKFDGLGIIQRNRDESKVSYHAQWVKRNPSDGGILTPDFAHPCWLGAVQVVIEETRSVVRESEIE